MPEYIAPDVHLEEVETSTAGFIGLCVKGPVAGTPQLVTNTADFNKKYGGYLSQAEFGEYRYLAYAVEHFFINGGMRAFIMRVVPPDAKCAESVSAQTLLKFTAKNPGLWGNHIRVLITPVSKAKTQILKMQKLPQGKAYTVKSAAGFQTGDIVALSDGDAIQYNQISSARNNVLTFTKDFDGDVNDTEPIPGKTLSTCEFTVEVKCDDIVERYENLSFNIRASSYAGNKMAESDIVNVVCTPPKRESGFVPPFIQLAGADKEILEIGFAGGFNGTRAALSAADFIGKDNGRRTGIQSFTDNAEVSIMAIPGVTDAKVQLALVAHCEKLGSRFAVLDLPRDSKKLDDVLAHRQLFDTHYAALYHPWLEIFDPLEKKNIAMPPSGAVLGIYVRSDNARGVHKAPANEVVRACIGLDCLYNKGEQDMLNPKGINLIRVVPGQGIRVWGARTATSNSLWKYVNVRRLFIFIEGSIKANIKWAAFESNDELLWGRVKRTIDVFLSNVWRNGALMGASPEEAFFVDVGRSTMSQDDIDNGRLICVIGAAPVKPAEFVIFRVTQKTASE